jgi:hypothetical protein
MVSQHHPTAHALRYNALKNNALRKQNTASEFTFVILGLHANLEVQLGAGRVLTACVVQELHAVDVNLYQYGNIEFRP